MVAGTAYYFLWNNPLGGLWLILLKGAGVGFLAIYAMRRTRGLDGALLVLMMALASAADMVLEINFRVGGVIFFASHLVACVLYLRHWRGPIAVWDLGIAAAFVIIPPLVSYLVSENELLAIYSVALGAMAATAWLSAYPRHRVAAGAMLFILSDWLLFARNGPFDPGPIADALVWPTYYAGQLMIATGVVQSLRFEAGRGAAPAV